MKNKLNRQSWLLALTGFSLLVALVLLSEGCGPGHEVEVQKGRELYVSYCQVCHGEKGDGAMAEQLSSPPPDLRQISARRDGEFPEEYIIGVIEGRERITGHPASDMPSFWVAIRNGENLQSDEETREYIGYVVEYLKSIQQ